VDADDWDPTRGEDAEILTVRGALAELVSGTARPIVDHDICLYTNTFPADRRPDKGEQIIIDRWPNWGPGHCYAASQNSNQILFRLRADQDEERFLSQATNASMSSA
jgi:hypothetical protein